MIEERVSKRHGLRFYVRVDWRGARYAVGTYPTLAKAKRAEREARNQIDAGTFVPAAELKRQPEPEPERVPTVAGAMADWLEAKRFELHPNTVMSYESAARLHIVPAIGQMDIRILTRGDVQKLVNRWIGDGMGARLINRCIVNLKAALELKIEERIIHTNVAIGVRKPSARTRKEMTAWTDDEIGRFLAVALDDERLAPFWAFTLLEGLRRGEALGARWRDLHWNDDDTAGVLTINQTVIVDETRGGAALVQDRTKTRAGRRSIQLTESTITVLKAHRDRQRFHRLGMADLWQDNNLIVCTSLGTPINPATIKRDRIALMKRAAVPAITTHQLRHMAATIMLKAGVSPAIVAQKIGHRSIETTIDLYGHLGLADQRLANEAIEAAVRKSS